MSPPITTNTTNTTITADQDINKLLTFTKLKELFIKPLGVFNFDELECILRATSAWQYAKEYEDTQECYEVNGWSVCFKVERWIKNGKYYVFQDILRFSRESNAAACFSVDRFFCENTNTTKASKACKHEGLVEKSKPLVVSEMPTDTKIDHKLWEFLFKMLSLGFLGCQEIYRNDEEYSVLRKGFYGLCNLPCEPDRVYDDGKLKITQGEVGSSGAYLKIGFSKQMTYQREIYVKSYYYTNKYDPKRKMLFYLLPDKAKYTLVNEKYKHEKDFFENDEIREQITRHIG